jgi:probable rRNA maturation factor
VTSRLSVGIQKSVRAGVAPGFLRGVLAAAVEEPAVADRLPARPLELTLRITGDRELRRLNRQFLDEDHVTDVLSFPGGDDGSGYLGDLALSWPAVVRQAAEHGHPEDVEAALLVVHGLLHLLGWDHASPADEREMTRLTLACLGRAGIVAAAGRVPKSAS